MTLPNITPMHSPETLSQLKTANEAWERLAQAIFKANAIDWKEVERQENERRLKAKIDKWLTASSEMLNSINHLIAYCEASLQLINELKRQGLWNE